MLRLARESRRFNAQLRTSRMTDPLHTIYKKDGSVSDGFPKDLGGLFQLDGMAHLIRHSN